MFSIQARNQETQVSRKSSCQISLHCNYREPKTHQIHEKDAVGSWQRSVYATVRKGICMGFPVFQGIVLRKPHCCEAVLPTEAQGFTQQCSPMRAENIPPWCQLPPFNFYHIRQAWGHFWRGTSRRNFLRWTSQQVCSSGDTPYAATRQAEITRLSHHFDYVVYNTTAQNNSSLELLAGEQHEEDKSPVPKTKHKQQPTALDSTHLREHKLQELPSKKAKFSLYQNQGCLHQACCQL